ncbi:TauD/TfdA family dioxygenase [Amycolatopsis aidingensis]|uniref:TauD/TfdA family dioxygenase n=1 Tax=Amycolatopsis aidingensis TaxID=2842453 RepID=UPI001C0BD9CF|nr:TauD/TfdA family dioxygenase [Amycolatopsis aidingensis]
MTRFEKLGTDVLSVDGAGLDISDERISELLLAAGAIEFDVVTLDVERFKAFKEQLIRRPAEYGEAATPRTAFAEGVWSATDLPGSQAIEPHNESSYRQAWPGRILFGCVQAPETGGQTTLTDVQGVLAVLPRNLVEEFQERDWLLVRNYQSGLGRTWQDAFSCNAPDDVHRYCRANEIDVEWPADDVLRTRQVRPALARHPVTGAELWFNHIVFWHASSLAPHVREYLEAEFGTEGLPFATYYGDGGVIPDVVVAEIREAYRRNTIEYSWREGMLMLLDNMRVAHGRLPFTGPRKILVGMGDEIERQTARVA